MPEPAFTAEQFEEAMRAIVDERGKDWVYPERPAAESPFVEQTDEWWIEGACRYIKPDLTPACIIGATLAKLVPADSLPEPNLVTSAADLLSRHFEIRDPDLLEAAGCAQEAQDTGSTWGEALEAFENRYL